MIPINPTTGHTPYTHRHCAQERRPSCPSHGSQGGQLLEGRRERDGGALSGEEDRRLDRATQRAGKQLVSISEGEGVRAEFEPPHDVVVDLGGTLRGALAADEVTQHGGPEACT